MLMPLGLCKKDVLKNNLNMHNPSEFCGMQNVVYLCHFQQWTPLLEELQHAFVRTIVIG